MTHFNDDYFRDLPPRDRRYDTPVADQLVFSVFPNGVKAWVHVYPCADYVRRRTIGLYPDMTHAAALEAMEDSRRIAEVDALEIRRRRPAVVHRKRFLLSALLVMILVAETAYLLVRPEPPRTGLASDAVPAAESAAPEGTRLGSGRPPEEVRESRRAQASDTPPEAVAHAADRGQIPRNAPASELSSPGAQEITVTRAVLTSDVRDREPVDQLTGALQSSRDATLTIFFFTELKGPSGETVVHQWRHDGGVVAEVPFTIGNGSRWRVFSSRTFAAGDAGDWRVTVVDGEGRLIESRAVEVVAPVAGAG